MLMVTLKAFNDELKRLGYDVHLDKGDGYFYFWGGEANDWHAQNGERLDVEQSHA